MSVQEESLPAEQLLGSDDQPLFGNEGDVWELGPRQTAAGWLRLALAIMCLSVAVLLTAPRFIEYVVHHVWNHSRNSPVALIVPVLAVEFLWIIVHVHTGGLIARLKIGLGAAAICMAFFAPSLQSLRVAGPGRTFDLAQIGALLLATWVFVDGWLDRRHNLKKDQPARI